MAALSAQKGVFASYTSLGTVQLWRLKPELSVFSTFDCHVRIPAVPDARLRTVAEPDEQSDSAEEEAEHCAELEDDAELVNVLLVGSERRLDRVFVMSVFNSQSNGPFMNVHVLESEHNVPDPASAPFLTSVSPLL